MSGGTLIALTVFIRRQTHLLVLLDFTDAASLVAETLGRIVPAQLLDQRTGIAGDVARELDRIDTLQDDVVRAHRIGSSERWRTCETRETIRRDPQEPTH